MWRTAQALSLTPGPGSKAMTEHYLKDFVVGQKFGSVRLGIDAARIKFLVPPNSIRCKPFHLNEEAAKRSILRGLAASGWHTAAITMRLLDKSELKPAGGIVGAGCDELKWPRPVRPGDELHVESELLDVWPSRSRGEIGIVKMGVTTFNQNGEPVQILVVNIIVPRRGIPDDRNRAGDTSVTNKALPPGGALATTPDRNYRGREA